MLAGLGSDDRAPNASRGDGSPWVVLKFGGTSVSSLERWETIRDVLAQRRREGFRPLVVCSALSQVSNQLERLLADAREERDLAPSLDRFRETHRALAVAMGLDARGLLGATLQELERTLVGISLTREVTPRLRARVMSTGELLSTRLGAAWLASQGVRAAWHDVRDLLKARREKRSAVGQERQFLSATCPDEPDPGLSARLRALDADVIVTQGFIARGPRGDTVLLGRGGSDTSASYLAARLQAARLEIWTDVPGLFTAHPGLVPDARLLLQVGYAEASELASRGAKVLHPRCLGPVRKQAIPLHLRCTRWPNVDGTVISQRPKQEQPGILGVVARHDLVLVNMGLDGTWQRVGVIAEIARCFQAVGLSIDMLASSQTHVTAVLDPAANQLSDAVLDALELELREVCEPRIDRRAASVSLVGTSIADVVHELGPLLENLEHENVHLVSHAANDLSLTVIVDQQASERVVRALHGKLFGPRAAHPSLGSTWDELRSRAEPSPS